MAVTLTSTLLAHQRAARKTPRLNVAIAQTRFGVPILQFTTSSADGSPDAPVAAVYDGSGTLYRARNNAGSLDLKVGAAAWANVDTVTAGQGFALAYDPVAAAVLLVYGDGNDLKLRTSASAFAAPTTLVTEASAIGAVALAVRASNGDACAFYVLGTSTTLKRLRRTAGAWAGAGTTWSKSASVATLTGLAAVHSGNYHLAITGTEVTTTDEKVWIVSMGDGPLPANTWSAFVTVAEADSNASLTFGYPSLAYVGSVLFCCFRQAEAGNVVAARVLLTSTTESGEELAHWTEPFPTVQLAGSYGFALARGSGVTALVGPTQLATSTDWAGIDLSASVLACSWRETPASLRLRLEFDHRTNADPFTPIGSRYVVGHDLTIQHGFASDTTETPPADEFGITLRANIARVTRRFVSGKATVLIEADGPWETFARYRAPQAWTAPSGYTRGQIFSRIAGRAGVEMVEASGGRAPSTAWSADTPGFAVAAGETAAAALARLLESTPDFTRISGAGAVEICGSFATAETPLDDEVWSITQRPGDHPLAELAVISEHQVNWVRLTGPDRYADAFHYDGLLAGNPTLYPAWPIMDHVRDLAASSDGLAVAGAEDAVLRHQWLAPFVELTAPVHVGQELYDVVEAQVDQPFDGGFQLAPGYGRIVRRGVDYKRGPAGAAFDSVLTLARVDYP